MSTKAISVLAAMVVLLATAASAGARTQAHRTARHPATLAPPGNSAVTQYLETVPTDGGSKPEGPAAGAPVGGASAAALPPARARALDNLGPDGRALAAVVADTAPVVLSTGGGSSRGAGALHRVSGGSLADRLTSGGLPSLDHTGTAASSPVSAVLAAATGRGGGGMGLLVTLVAVAGVLGLGLGAWRRRAQRQ